MDKRFLYILLFGLTTTIFTSCGNNQEKKTVKPFDTVNVYKKPLEDVNKKLVEAEDKEINDFIARHGWKMSSTGTGLRYLIYKSGNGESTERGKVAKMNFEVRLITGDLCYSSKTDGPKEMLMGKSGEISGLEEALLLMKVGDKAKFIIPSHLAFGLLGDENKIPKRATLVYDIELLEIKNAINNNRNIVN
jgi:FKBP-type peptidyl-prolyl cis-trans isomerase